MVAVEKANNISIEASFFEAQWEKLVVEGREKLSDIKGKNARVALLKPTCPDEVSKIYACIYCRSLADTSKLMRVEEAISW